MYMISKGGGAVINVASYTGLMGIKNYSAHVTLKAGVVCLTKALAFDSALCNIYHNYHNIYEYRYKK